MPAVKPVPIVGAPGTASGVIDADDAEATLVPSGEVVPLVAVTEKVYAVPAVNPVTVHPAVG